MAFQRDCENVRVCARFATKSFSHSNLLHRTRTLGRKMKNHKHPFFDIFKLVILHGQLHPLQRKEMQIFWNLKKNIFHNILQIFSIGNLFHHTAANTEILQGWYIHSLSCFSFVQIAKFLYIFSEVFVKLKHLADEKQKDRKGKDWRQMIQDNKPLR